MSIEEKYDEVRQLINIGKEKGYLLYDEVKRALTVGNHLFGRARRPVQYFRERRDRSHRFRSEIPARRQGPSIVRPRAPKSWNST